MNDPTEMTAEEVKIYAIQSDNAILYQYVTYYEAGRITWEQAMQGAAITIAQSNYLMRQALQKR